MLTDTDVRQALHGVIDPEIRKPIDEIGMLGGFAIDGDTVTVDILLTVPGCPHTDEITARVRAALEPIGATSVEVRFGEMEPEQRAQMASGLQKEMPFRRPDSRTTVIGVSSGKGGVGKSTVTTNIAAALNTLGHRVGVLDADIWGFSIPRMFGLRGRRPVAFDGMIMPLDRNGVKVISIGFFLPSEEEAVVWRGPMLHKALEQFLTDVYWGDDLEYLLIDLPPGTGDVSLSLATFLPNMGMLVVTTPQPVAQKVAERAANMAGKVKQRLLGVVENMSGSVFGDGGGQELADVLGIPLLGKLPLAGEIRESSDAGEPFVWSHPDDPTTAVYMDVARKLAEFRPRRRLPVMEIGSR